MILDVGSDDFSLAWSIINDHYLTDLPLLYAPHVVAVTSILLALTLKPNTISSQTQASSLGSFKMLEPHQEHSSTTTKSAVTVQQAKIEQFTSWLAEGRLNLEAVIECSQEMLSLYSVLDQVNDSICEKQITRYMKARGLDK